MLLFLKRIERYFPKGKENAIIWINQTPIRQQPFITKQFTKIESVKTFFGRNGEIFNQNQLRYNKMN
jgi:hypothetical protein